MAPRDVFISHSSGDAEVARELRAVLEDAGYSCWMAPDDIVGTETWTEQILGAIADSKVMVVLVSAAANARPTSRARSTWRSVGSARSFRSGSSRRAGRPARIPPLARPAPRRLPATDGHARPTGSSDDSNRSSSAPRPRPFRLPRRNRTRRSPIAGRRSHRRPGRSRNRARGPGPGSRTTRRRPTAPPGPARTKARIRFRRRRQRPRPGHQAGARPQTLGRVR